MQNHSIDIKESVEDDNDVPEYNGETLRPADLFGELPANETDLLAPGFTEVRFDGNGVEVEVVPNGDEDEEDDLSFSDSDTDDAINTEGEDD